MDQMTNEAAAAYLAAFIDGEGHIGVHPLASGYWSRTISFVNTEKALFDQVVAILAQLGLAHRTYFSKAKKEKWSDKWVCSICSSKANFERFRVIIPLQSPKKRAKLDELIASYVDPELTRVRRRTGKRRACCTCGKPVYVAPSHDTETKFCSNTCKFASRRRSAQGTCAKCGTVWLDAPYRIRARKYCSAQCFQQERREGLAAMAKLAATARWHPASLL